MPCVFWFDQLLFFVSLNKTLQLIRRHYTRANISNVILHLFEKVDMGIFRNISIFILTIVSTIPGRRATLTILGSSFARVLKM